MQFTRGHLQKTIKNPLGWSFENIYSHNMQSTSGMAYFYWHVRKKKKKKRHEEKFITVEQVLFKSRIHSLDIFGWFLFPFEIYHLLNFNILCSAFV